MHPNYVQSNRSVISPQILKRTKSLTNGWVQSVCPRWMTSVTFLWPCRHLGIAGHCSDNFCMREYLYGAWESGERKPLQYAGLFCFLAITYAIYVGMHLGVFHARDNQIAKLCFISALPFTLLAYSDSDWCSNDAAPVCLAAWIAVCVGFSFRCPVCIVGLAVTFFPFILSALLAHGVGASCRFLQGRIRS
jgi:hypothetical protein